MGSVSLGGYRRNLGLIAIAVGWLALGMVGIYSTAASEVQLSTESVVTTP